MADAPIVGRLAPSPSGRLHLGHARSFLLAWWSARSRGGRIVLRIEDLDAERVKPGAVDLVLEDLAWLGLDWDGEPLLQSSRTAAHGAALAALVEAGRAYPCVCTRKEIEEASRAPHGGETRYPGTCRWRFASLAAATESTGLPAALRLAVEPGPVIVDDALRGPTAFDVAAEVGDFVIARKDGVAAYQLATPLDDAYQAVTEVLRGDDLLSSAARQRLVLEALDLPIPRQIHVPLVHDSGGPRLAKRAGSLSLAELRAEGVPASEVVSWAAEASGLPRTPPDPRTAGPGAWLEAFELSRVPRHAVHLAPNTPEGTPEGTRLPPASTGPPPAKAP